MSSTSKPAIAILGSGNMGRVVGISLVRAGYPVLFAGRTPTEAPQRAAALASRIHQNNNGPKVSHGTIAEGVHSSSILLWTSRETDITQVFDSATIAYLKERSTATNPTTIMDLNNWNMQVLLSTGVGATLDKPSSGEALQASFRAHGLDHVHVFKVFNTLPQEVFAYDAEGLRKEGVQVFIAGVEETSKIELKDCLKKIVGDMGFEAVDLGSGPQSARMAEMMGDVVRFCLMKGVGNGAWSHIGVRGMPEVSTDAIGIREKGNYV